MSAPLRRNRSAWRSVAVTLGAGLALASPSIAHEDDPKVLDRKPAVPGPGYRSALPGNLAGIPHSAAAGGQADGIELESWLTLSALGNGNDTGNDCWGYVSPSGREYALMGTSGATIVVEVTNPGNPQIIQRISGPNSLWRDLKTYQDRCYVVTEGGGGIQVLDLSNVDNGVVTLENTVNTGGTSSTHNVAIDEVSGFLYRTGGGSNGLRIYSLANPSNPVFVGSYNARYVHDAQVVTYTSGPLSGRQIAYCCAGLGNGGTDTGLTIVDVTNKSNPAVIEQIAYPSRAYSHQGWLSEDRTRFYLGDELDEGNNVSVTTTHVFNVEDPANTQYLGAFDNGDPAIGHNMYSHKGLLFQANYTSGLRVFDLASNKNNPVETAFYDTAPSSTSVSFNGLWSCYPYFPSGTVIGSDLESGLFVWSVDHIEIDVTAGAPTLLDPSGDTVDVTITGYNAGSLNPSTPQLVYNIGGGDTTVPLTSNGGNSYTATFPALPCGTTVSWRVTASSNLGRDFAEPNNPGAPNFTSMVGSTLIVARDDDMQTNAGWVGGAAGDTATTGTWTRGNPLGTAAQPENDFSTDGAACWFTGQGSNGGSIGENDVDGGFTTLLTPILDLSALTDPTISYYRWYSNNQGGSANADVFEVEISSNGGSTWTSVETVGPDTSDSNGGWFQYQFRASDLITLTSQVQMRFIASDLGGGSIVEAAIDEFMVTDVDCGDGIGTSYCQASSNSTGNASEIVGSGSASLAANNLVLTAVDLPMNVNGYFVVSPNQAFVPNAGGSQGNLCVGLSTGRYISQLGNSGTTGELALVVDNTAIPQPTGAVAAMVGESWNFQCWHRDAILGIAGSNFSRGYSVTFE